MPKREARLDAHAMALFLSAEECVMLDAALEAQERLRAMHIKRLTDGRELTKHLSKLSGDIETQVSLTTKPHLTWPGLHFT